MSFTHREIRFIGHRGYSTIAPENTLAAMKAAIAGSAWGVEFDVQLTRDAIPVVIHDSTLERTTNGGGKVAALSLAELKTLDAGSWFSPHFVGESIPTLTEVLALIQPTSLKIYPEIKFARNWSESQIAALCEQLGTPIWQQRCTIASFEYEFLQRLRQRNLEIAIAFEVGDEETFHEAVELAYKYTPGSILCHYTILLNNPALLEIPRARDIEVIPWTVDRPEERQQLAKLGIEAMITNAIAD